jgi:hypothetical protein
MNVNNQSGVFLSSEILTKAGELAAKDCEENNVSFSHIKCTVENFIITGVYSVRAEHFSITEVVKLRKPRKPSSTKKADK